MRASAEERHNTNYGEALQLQLFKYSKFPKYCLLDTKRINCGSDPMVRPSKKNILSSTTFSNVLLCLHCLSFKIILSLSLSLSLSLNEVLLSCLD